MMEKTTAFLKFVNALRALGYVVVDAPPNKLEINCPVVGFIGTSVILGVLVRDAEGDPSIVHILGRTLLSTCGSYPPAVFAVRRELVYPLEVPEGTPW